MLNYRKTKIIATIGPASNSIEMMRKLVEAGANVFRLNFSHNTHEGHGESIAMIQELRRNMDLPLAILMDTKGPEIRTGKLSAGKVELKEGQAFTLTTKDVVGNENIVSVSHKGLPHDIGPGSTVLLDDGLIEMTVDSIEDEDIRCIVKNSGTLGDTKGVNLPGAALSLPAVTERDIEDIKFAINAGVEIVAASFIRKASDVIEMRRIIADAGGHRITLISKIENQEGLNNLDEILQLSDGIMVARGDLGVETPTEEMPLVQKRIIHKCNIQGKPVITATQMLDSMMRNPRPTRAETTDVANAILDGTDAIMLSGETAAGKYPVECIRTMVNIAKRTEADMEYWKDIPHESGFTITHAVSHATCTTARDLGASAIITATSTGNTAAMIARYRPRTPVVATTMRDHARHAMALIWGVMPFIAPRFESTDEMIEKSIKIAQDAGVVKEGDIAVITAGIPLGSDGTTNMLKVHMVGDIILSGNGVGQHTVSGKARVIGDVASSGAFFEKGDILVAKRTDYTMLPIMRKAAAIIVEDPDPQNHAVVVGMALETPVIFGAVGAAELLRNEMRVSVDPTNGTVHNASARMP